MYFWNLFPTGILPNSSCKSSVHNHGFEVPVAHLLAIVVGELQRAVLQEFAHGVEVLKQLLGRSKA
eukprot:COSAG02_NODE_4409_length_5393_cov_2.878164_1_plen_66_part_00